MDISKCGYTESTTTLLISYTPIQNKKFKVWKPNVDIVKFFATFPLLMAYIVFFFNFFFFLMWAIFKVFIEFVTILLLFYVLIFWPRGMWDLSSPTRNQTRAPCIVRQSLNHWTTREVPIVFIMCVCVACWNSVPKYPCTYI